MRFTYNQSAFLAERHKDDPDYFHGNFCPDFILNTIEEKLEKLSRPLAKIEAGMTRKDISSCSNFYASSSARYTNEQCLAIKDECISYLDPENKFDFHNMEKGYFVIREDEVSNGYVQEEYYNLAIFLFQNGSLHDAFNMAHEYGHFVANRKHSDLRYPPAIPVYVREAQAFFMEECAYDLLSDNGMKPDIVLAKTQRVIQQMDNLASGLAADKYCKMVAFENEGPVQKNFYMNAARTIHGHAPGFIIGSGLYHIFKASDSVRREQILAALLNSGDHVNIKDVFASAGIKTTGNVQGFLNTSMEQLIESCRFSSPQAVPARPLILE